MKCKHCLSKVFETDRTCPSCGAPLGDTFEYSSDTKKVVVNKCFGGFGLSSEAVIRLIEMNCDSIKSMSLNEYTGGKSKLISSEKFNKLRDGYEVGWIEGVLYKDDYVYFYQDDNREDLDLIFVVETMKEKASSNLSRLEIVEIPKNVDYVIDEYDGLESIHEKHKSW